MPPRIDLIGFKYNRLTVVRRGGGLSNGKTCWVCECSCGNWTIVAVDKLRSGYTKSCGCLNDASRRVRAKAMSFTNIKYPAMDRVDWHTYSTYVNGISSRYKISEGDVVGIMNDQKGCCRICSRSLDYLGKVFAVDHCHKSGEVRGLLCHNCNIAIGNMQDNPEILKAGANYLERHKWWKE